jgi:tRNA G18 (ribose-2'-O)-methylase SpoU
MKPQDYWVRNECGSDRISLTEACAQPRLPIFGVLDNIRSAHNVGSMFRTADGANIGELLICGYSPTPPHKHLSKTHWGGRCRAVAPLRDGCRAIEDLRARNVQVLAVEFTDDSTSLHDFPLQFPLALVMGNEAEGLSDETRSLCDATVHLPMHV